MLGRLHGLLRRRRPGPVMVLTVSFPLPADGRWPDERTVRQRARVSARFRRSGPGGHLARLSGGTRPLPGLPSFLEPAHCFRVVIRPRLPLEAC